MNTEENMGNADSNLRSKNINDAQSKVAYWRKLLFLLSLGSVGKRFTEEMTRLLIFWIYKTEQDSIAMKALIISSIP